MADDPTRAGLRIALQAAVRDRDRALATISFLTEKLGITEPTGPVILGPGDMDPDAETPREVGPVSVSEGEFFGMSQPKAATAFLERAGRSRPQRTEAIVAALKKGGVEFAGKDPVTTFYTIMRRNPAFHRVGKSTWGLSIWYPNSAKKPAKASGEAPAATTEGSDEAPASDEAQGDIETPGSTEDQPDALT